MLPKAFARLLMGRGANELRRRRPPIHFELDPELVARAKEDPRVRRDLTAGGFVVVDEAPAPAAAVTVTPLEEGVGQSLAAEALRLASGVEE